MDEKQDIFHYGTKGMKWGVRKKRDSGPTDVTVRAVPGKRIKSAGGTGHPASEDAVKATVSRQKARKSGPQALSNKELQELVQRMNLEQQYSRLAAQNASPAVKFVRDTILGVGKQQATRIVNEAASVQVSELMKKQS